MSGLQFTSVSKQTISLNLDNVELLELNDQYNNIIVVMTSGKTFSIVLDGFSVIYRCSAQTDYGVDKAEYKRIVATLFDINLHL
jgi:hypothetical protein